MESVNKKIIFITLILTIFTSLLIYVYITRSSNKTTDVVEYVNTYVAAKTLPPKYKIIDSDIKLVKIKKEDMNVNALTNPNDIIGKRVKESIMEGEQIVGGRLMDEKKSTLSSSMPEGMRAVSLNVQEQMIVSNLIRPGDFVDIIASFEKEEIEEATQITIFPRVTKIILQNIEILSLGQDTVITDEKIKDTPKTITVAISPQDAEKLVYASEYATLRLVLRHTDDNEILKTDGVNREDVATGKGVYKVTK
jgi:Flp pilus assembly protein CpaB